MPDIVACTVVLSMCAYMFVLIGTNLYRIWRSELSVIYKLEQLVASILMTALLTYISLNLMPTVLK